MIETFGECLQAWMKETSHSFASVAAEMNLKSKTTVARILQGESTCQGCQRFYETLADHIPLDEKWKKRFTDALCVEKVGPLESALFQILTEHFISPQPETARPDAGKPESVLILGCPWPQTKDYILQRLSENSEVRIFHYITVRELQEQPSVLSCLLSCLTDARYQAFLVEDQLLFQAGISWNIIIRADLTSGREQIAVKSSVPFDWLSLYTSQHPFAGFQKDLSELNPKPLYHNEDLKNGSDYIRLQKESWLMENRHSKALLKPMPGIQMFPPELVINSFTDFLSDNVSPISTTADSNIYYFRRRAEDFYAYETKMIHSRQTMIDFIHIGTIPDQFFACRPFTEEERLAVLHYLLDRMQMPQVTLLFTEAELSRHTIFESFSKFGTLIYPSETSYNAEKDAYRELILPGDFFAGLFHHFIEEVIIPEYCGSELESRRFIAQLISQLEGTRNPPM